MTSNKEQPAQPQRTPSFEDSLLALEEIVAALEDGQLGLSDSLKRYEEGVKHLKHCYQALTGAERRIELLAGIDAEGNPITQPFDEPEEALEEKQRTPGQRRGRSQPSKSRSGKKSDVDEMGGLF